MSEVEILAEWITETLKILCVFIVWVIGFGLVINGLMIGLDTVAGWASFIGGGIIAFFSARKMI